MSDKLKNIKPPNLILKFFRWFCRPDCVEDIEGDLLERFEKRKKEKKFARIAFGFDVLRLFRPGIIRSFENSQLNNHDMLKHNFKIGYRNLLRRKGHAFINVSGLAIGIAVAMLIGLWIYDELTINKSHHNYADIAQVMQHQIRNGDRKTQEAIPMPLGPELQNKYGSDFEYVVMSSWPWNSILSYEKNNLSMTGRFMDVDAPYLLSLKMLMGSRDGLSEYASVLISENTATSLFGNENPMNKVIKINNNLNVAIKGVYEDLPSSSHFKNLSFIASWELHITTTEWLINARKNPQWDNNSFNLYVQVADNTDLHNVSNKIRRVKYDNLNEGQKALDTEVFLHLMKDWHLRSSWKNGIQNGGLILYVWLFGIIGGFVLILACINFINLSTANAEKRAKEVGIRKSLGSQRSQLINQFFTESFLVVILAYLVAIILVLLSVPSFNQLAGKQLIFPSENILFWVISLFFIVITGLFAGCYPALYLSSFRPINVLKGAFLRARSAAIFRKVLVIIQFTVSITLVIGTIVVWNQVQHSKNRPIGYDINRIVSVEMTTPAHYGKFDLLRNKLKGDNAIVEMTQSSSPMTDVWNYNDGFSWEDKDSEFSPLLGVVWVTHEYGKTIGWDIIEGRDFSKEYATDERSFVINEAAAKYMNLNDHVGKKIKWNRNREYEIIGIVKNLIMESPFAKIKPTIYVVGDESRVNFMSFKLNPDRNTQETIAKIKGAFNEFLPEVPLEYQFTDQEYALKFFAEERIGKLSGLFAVLAIFISCIGLFGMASYMAERRTKEIGIRKVLGASILGLWKMLSKDFILLVSLSCLIAIPIAYFALDNWLQNYEYRTKIHWWIFVCASLGAMLITFITVSYQSLNAASINPVKSLRDE